MNAAAVGSNGPDSMLLGELAMASSGMASSGIRMASYG